MVEVADSVAATVVERLSSAVDNLHALDLSRLSRDELLDLARALERQRRRLPVVDHALVGEFDRRGTAGDFGARSTAALLVGLLGIDPSEATGRVRAAADLGPRVTVGGAPQPALFPILAAAQREGVISAAAARVIMATVDALPESVQDEHADAVESFLTDQAGHLDPRQLAGVARRVRDMLDPDGTLATDDDHARRRDLTLRPHRDGSADLSGYLDPACAAVWQTVLDSLSRPMPAEEGAIDSRTAGQRRHDGLHDAGMRLLRSDRLPESGGCPVTVLLTVDQRELGEHQATAGDGPRRSTGWLARSAHGGLLSRSAFLRLAGEARLVPVALDGNGAATASGDQPRLATGAQRRVLAARDGGCSFPGCSVPPAWCQAHHVAAWHEGGPTTVANLTLLCGHHHRSFEAAGWTCDMRDGVPWWRPPRWVDPEQRPRRNVAHHPPLRFSIPSAGTSDPELGDPSSGTAAPDDGVHDGPHGDRDSGACIGRDLADPGHESGRDVNGGEVGGAGMDRGRDPADRSDTEAA
ncbi:MAG: DUF222 domain-containing protein [bacterium]